MSNNYQPLRPTKLRQKVSSAARRWARDLRRWSWSPWPSPEGAPSSAAACPCPTEPGEDGKIGRRNVTCILWHVYEMYDVFDMYWNVDSWRWLCCLIPRLLKNFAGSDGNIKRLGVPFWWWTIHASKQRWGFDLSHLSCGTGRHACGALQGLKVREKLG